MVRILWKLNETLQSILREESQPEIIRRIQEDTVDFLFQVKAVFQKIKQMNWKSLLEPSPFFLPDRILPNPPFSLSGHM